MEDGDQQECWRTVKEENQLGDDDGREDGIAKFERDVRQLEERKRAQRKHIEMRLGQCQESRGRRSEEVEETQEQKSEVSMWRQTWAGVSHSTPRRIQRERKGRVRRSIARSVVESKRRKGSERSKKRRGEREKREKKK